MPSKKPAPSKRKATTTPLVVVPPPPKAERPGSKPSAKPAKKAVGGGRPLDPREFPKARDSRGTASREEIRRESPRVSAPRQGPVGRSGKPKSGTRGAR